jgi:hypothetical protein
LRGLVEVVDKQAQFFRLEFRETEAKGLLGLVIAQDHDSMALRDSQILDLEAVLVGPEDRLLLINLQ